MLWTENLILKGLHMVTYMCIKMHQHGATLIRRLSVLIPVMLPYTFGSCIDLEIEGANLSYSILWKWMFFPLFPTLFKSRYVSFKTHSITWKMYNKNISGTHINNFTLLAWKRSPLCTSLPFSCMQKKVCSHSLSDCISIQPVWFPLIQNCVHWSFSTFQFRK